MLSKDAKATIRKYAIKNAVDYGKASLDSVLGKALSKIENSRSIIDEIRAGVEKAVKEVNALKKDELLKEYQKYEGEFESEEKKKIEKTSKPKMVLEGAKVGAFVTRFAPAPNGYLHIGSAKAAWLARDFATIYKGRNFLYFDDTNPEKDRQEYVDAIKRDLKWMGITFDDEYYASDSMELIYDSARKMLEKGSAYVCTCNAEKLKSDRFNGVECEHRLQKDMENMELFEQMLRERYEEGTAIVRFRGDMRSQNTAMRDPTLLRIKRDRHYRQGNKYIVWPTYDLNTPINDSVHGVTDAIRSKEYELRDEVYYAVLDALGMRKAKIRTEARLVIKNNTTHKRELNRLIKEGKLKGFDDPRLVTIEALRARGIQPLAIKSFVLMAGMSKTDAKMDISALLAENKKIIDPTAKRLFYVHGPVKVVVKGAKEQTVKLRLHPTSNLGFREYKVGDTFYISGTDAADLKVGEVVRFKDLYSVRVRKASKGLIEAGYSADGETENRIQWVSEGNYSRCAVTIPHDPIDDNGNFNSDSLELSKGYVENYARSLKDGEVVQFERFGFCALHDRKSLSFIFTSK